MRVLVACEESQAVTKEFRALGHEAFSCDIQDCSGGHPEWHIKGDVLAILNDGWDMMIAFPPCTYFSRAGNGWFNIDKYGERAVERYKKREEAFKFTMMLANSNIEKIAIENPPGYLNTKWRKPDQIFQPWMFGDEFQKATCLWLKKLPILLPTKIVGKGEIHVRKNGQRKAAWQEFAIKLPADERAKFRSKTLPGIARAMATQWGTP